MPTSPAVERALDAFERLDAVGTEGFVPDAGLDDALDTYLDADAALVIVKLDSFTS